MRTEKSWQASKSRQTVEESLLWKAETATGKLQLFLFENMTIVPEYDCSLASGRKKKDGVECRKSSWTSRREIQEVRELQKQ